MSMFADTAEYEEMAEQAAMFRWLRDNDACVHCSLGMYFVKIGYNSQPFADTYEAAIRAAMEQGNDS